MQALSRLVFVVGCLGAAFFLVERPLEVRWVPFGAALLVAGVGIVAMRWSAPRRSVTDEGVHHDAPARRALTELDAWLKVTADEKVDLSNLPARIDADVKPLLRTVEADLDELRHRLGLEAFAAFMDGYARGERALNRAWSAAADGYLGEARKQLRIGELALQQAVQALPPASRSWG